MEDLLASIRKAINEDIGDVPTVPSEKALAQAPAPRAQPRAEEPAPTSSEIQQLREKITRSRTADAGAARDPSQRAASLAAALRSDTPRRAWGEIEPAPPKQPPLSAGLRGSILDNDAPRPAVRPAPVGSARPAPRFTFAERQPLKPTTAQPSGPAAEEGSGMLSGGSAQAVQSAFSRLADSVLARATGDRSVEDMTRELLRVMLKQWLDDNLPQLVEKLVREEIERVARTGR